MPGIGNTVRVEELERDPYPIYRRLRREAPVTEVEAVNSWFVTRWDDVNFVAMNPDKFSARDMGNPVCLHFGTPAILHSEGDEHAQLRGGIAPHYMPRKVADYIDTLVRPTAEEWVGKVLAQGGGDLMADYFEPVSVLSLARSFGLHEADVATLRRWFAGLAQGAINYERNPERTAVCSRVVTEIHQALSPILDRLERESDGSPLAHMLHHGMSDGTVRPREFIMPSVLVTLLGGMQEPGHGAGTTVYALLADSEQMRLVRDDMNTHLRCAVQEGVRWVSPIGTQVRLAVEDIPLGGVTIPAGASVAAVIASANRDEAIFEDPDRFDLRRYLGKAPTASFGFGQHFCAGKWFALAQMELALRILLENTENIALDPARPPQFRGWEFRAPSSLHVTVEAARH